MRLGGVMNRDRYVKRHRLRKYAVLAERLLGIRTPDTGYLLAQAARAQGLKWIMLDLVERHHPDWTRLPVSHGGRELAEQYELYTYAGRPILTHKYGTSAWLWRTNRGGDKEYWREMIGLAERELDQQSPFAQRRNASRASLSQLRRVSTEERSAH